MRNVRHNRAGLVRTCVGEKEKLRSDAGNYVRRYVAQSSGTSADIIDCTREREDKRATGREVEERKRKRGRRGERVGERGRERTSERACEGWHEPRGAAKETKEAVRRSRWHPSLNTPSLFAPSYSRSLCSLRQSIENG